VTMGSEWKSLRFLSSAEGNIGVKSVEFSVSCPRNVVGLLV
jgi:hypothetical protein